MSVDITNLYKRYTELENEVAYSQRKRKEEAENIYNVLQGISDSDIDLLSKEVPELAELREFTIDDILSNQHGEVNRIPRIYSKLTELLDAWLKHFEDAL